MERNLIQQENNFEGGSDRDTSLQDIKFNAYFEGNDICVSSAKENTGLSINPNDGNTQVFSLGKINLAINQIFRIFVDTALGGTQNVIQVITPNGTLYSQDFETVLGSQAARFSFLTSAIGTWFISQGLTSSVATIAHPGIYDYWEVEFTGATQEYSIFTTSNNNTQESIILREKIYAYNFGSFRGVETIQLENDLFILSTNTLVGFGNGGVSQISVARKDIITGIWTHTVLLQTKNIPINDSFGVVTQLKGEITNNIIRLYWVDGNDYPRSFYVVKQNNWVANSSLKYYSDFDLVNGNPDGFYIYNSIDRSTRLQIFNNSSYCSDIIVNNGNGFFTSGNKRFSIRLKAQNTVTGFGVLSNPIPVPIRSLTTIVGGGGQDSSSTVIEATGIQTNKSVTLHISGIDNTEFTDFEIGVVEYIGNSISAYVLGSFPLKNGDFSIEIKGNENKRILDIGTFVDFQPVIKTAHLNEIVQNIYFLGRIELQQKPDISSWVQSVFVNAQILTKHIQTVGSAGFENPNNEYYNPSNVFKYTGFMYGETYRYGMEVNFTNGLKSTYFGKDITITNGDLGKLTSGNRWDIRYDGTYSLIPDNINVYYVNIPSIDFTTAPDIDGIPFIQVVESVKIVRCECIPEIICAGYALLSYQGYYDSNSIKNTTLSFPPIARRFNDLSYQLIYYNTPFYTVLAGAAQLENRSCGNFISQDISCGLVNPIPLGEEQFIDYGEPIERYSGFAESNAKVVPSPTSGDADSLLFFGEYGGNFRNDYASNPGIRYRKIASLTAVKWGTIGTIIPDVDGINGISAISPTDYRYWCEDHLDNDPADYISIGSITDSSDGLAFRLDRDIFDQTGLAQEAGAHYSQLYRPIKNKYGDIRNNTYLSLGTFLKLGGTNGYKFTNVAMFSGDTFTQKSYQKMIYNCRATWVVDHVPPAQVDNYIKSGVSYYSQNRVNSQYKNAAGNDPAIVPMAYQLNTSDVVTWLNGNGVADNPSLITSEPFNFDLGYLPKDGVRDSRVFDPTLKQITSQGSSIYNSDPNLESDLTDQYRIIRALNIKTYETTDGVLTGLNKFNNNLVIHQNTMVSIQPISPNVTIPNSDLTGLILGSGTVLGTQITPLTRTGTTLKSSIKRFIKRNGKEEISWYSTNRFQILSLGQDGVKPLSLDHKYDNFLINNNDFIANENDYYINYDPYYNTAFFIANAISNSGIGGATLWNNHTAYTQGQKVFMDFYYPIRYKAKINVPINKSPQDDDNFFQYWEYDRNSNYNLAFSFDKKQDETLTGFIGFMSFMPYLIATYKDTFLSMISYQSNQNNLYYFSEHHINPDCNYYNGNVIGKPYVTSVINKNPKNFKDFMKAFFDSDLPPIRLELLNPLENTKTYIKAPDINKYRNLYRATTKRDATISVINPNGLNNIDGTKQMRSEIFKFKIFLQKQMNLRTIFLTLLDKFRNFNN